MQLNIPLSNILPNQTTGGASGAPLDAEVEATLVRSQKPLLCRLHACHRSCQSQQQQHALLSPCLL